MLLPARRVEVHCFVWCIQLVVVVIHSLVFFCSVAHQIKVSVVLGVNRNHRIVPETEAIQEHAHLHNEVSQLLTTVLVKRLPRVNKHDKRQDKHEDNFLPGRLINLCRLQLRSQIRLLVFIGSGHHEALRHGKLFVIKFHKLTQVSQ